VEARLLIGGEHVAGAGAGLEVENPYTGRRSPRWRCPRPSRSTRPSPPP